MDLSVSALPATFLQTPAFSQQQVVVRGNAGSERDLASSSSAKGNDRRDDTRVDLSLAAQQSSAEEERKAEASAAAPQLAGFSFEYQDRQQVMKVHNGKGVLIYQVPSKGQLALIQAADNDAQRNSKISLTA